MSHTNDTFTDSELTIMALQIMNDLQYKSNLDPSEEELSTLAMEIMKDLSLKQNIDTNDSYIQKLDSIPLFDHDIASQISSNVSTNSSTNSSTISSTKNTENTPKYPSISPHIVSSNRKISDDSFTAESIAIPPIPSPTYASKFQFPVQKKCAVNGWIQYLNWKKNHHATNGMLPYIQPPKLFIDKSAPTLTTSAADLTLKNLSPQSLSPSRSSDIASCISPRCKTPKQRFSNIPDFTTEPPPQILRPRLPPKIASKSMQNRSKLVEKRPLKTIVSPIFIDVNRKKNGWRSKKKMMSCTPTVRQSNPYNMQLEKKNKKTMIRRAKSIVGMSNKEKTNEYAVETDEGFIFINSYKW